jgi:DNA polymerase III alpha subunit
MRRAVTKKHEYMKFLTLEDRHGVVEAVVFPDVYRRCGATTAGPGCYRVTGQVDEQHGAVNVVADDIQQIPLPR